MYSSLALAHGCPPLIYVYTNSGDVVKALGPTFKTTFGSAVNVLAIEKTVESIDMHGFSDPWIRLSRHKLDIIQDHLFGDKPERLIWIDIDTFVFEDLTELYNSGKSWVIGNQHGKRTGLEILGTPIPPAFDAQGDLWMIKDRASIDEILHLEESIIDPNNRPTYDLQGYFSVLLSRASKHFRLVTDIVDRNFGFQCSNYEHPMPGESYKTEVCQEASGTA